jgi:P27 family predicted phage terminase small subunit
MPRRSKAELASPQPVRLVPSASVPAELPPAPEHLSPAMQAWWKQVMTDYALDPHHLRLLEAAADAWDRMTQARDVLRDEGLTVTTAHGSKKHPAADIERDSRLAFARLLRELDLDADPPKETPEWRPPPIRSNRRR